MHVFLLILSILFLAAYRALLLPVAAITEILCIMRDKWLEPVEVKLIAAKESFADEVFDRHRERVA